MRPARPAWPSFLHLKRKKRLSPPLPPATRFRHYRPHEPPGPGDEGDRRLRRGARVPRAPIRTSRPCSSSSPTRTASAAARTSRARNSRRSTQRAATSRARSSGSTSPARTSRTPGSSGKWATPTSAAGRCRDRCRARRGSTRPDRAGARHACYELDGRPADGRSAPRAGPGCRALQRAGLTPVVAVELEFYLLQRDATARLRTARRAALRRSRRPHRRLRTRPARRHVAAVRRSVCRRPRAGTAGAHADVGVRAGTVRDHARASRRRTARRGRSDPLQACGAWRRARHGCIACFMAKPFAEHGGLRHAPAREPRRRAGTQRVRERRSGRHADCCATPSADCAATMADGMAVFAPHANSYRRFRAMSYAPVAADLGRQQPLRQPARAGRAAREPTRRASCGRRRREPVPRRRAGARRHAARHRGRASTRARRSIGNGYEQAPRGELPTHWQRRARTGRRLRIPRRRARRGFPRRYSSRSSGVSARSSARWCRIATTSGISTPRETCNISSA